MAKFSEFHQQGKNENLNEKVIRDRFDEYKNMSQQELTQTLFREVAKQKNAGNFDYETLAGMVDSLQGALPAKDYENIRSLLESLK